jgi:hypothetical protein
MRPGAKAARAKDRFSRALGSRARTPARGAAQSAFQWARNRPGSIRVGAPRRKHYTAWASGGYPKNTSATA